MSEETEDLTHFRATVRDWLEQNCPPEMRQPMRSVEDVCWGGRHWKFASDAQKIWLERMAAKGWTVPEWPQKYGGGGLSRDQARIVRAEMKKIKARPPLQSFGIWMLGPALLKYGNEEQKLEHLPKIARGEIRWAQGYSEPNAGSDLASLMTKCEDRGDHYEVTGQKVWTSYADQADWIFVLVRTDFEAKKHEGISFILVDMDQPGVTTRPIKLISGKSPFCETFFDKARAEKKNLIGEINKGWTIAKYLLTHEREMIGGMGSDVMRPVGDIAVQQIGLGEDKKLADKMLRTDLARMEIDGLAFMETLARVQQEAKAGTGVGANSSMLKYYGTELNKRRLELMMDCAGSEGLSWGAENDLAANWLRTKANSIEGGTSEVQLNIIAKRILQLPST